MGGAGGSVAEQGETRIGVAFAMMIGATTLFPIGDTFSKILTGLIDPLEVTFWRVAFQSVALGALAWALPSRAAGETWSPILALGGITTAVMVACLISSFAVMPIATAIAIFFVGPLILTVFSALFLGENVGWRRYAAVLAGLAGAVVVIRPNWATFGLSGLLPLGAAMTFAATMVLVRKASATRTGLTIQIGMSVYAALLLGAGLGLAGLAGRFDWTPAAAPAWVWPLFALMGVISGATFLLIAEAYKLAPASILAPTQYFEIVGATLLGYLVFGDFPDPLTWAGTAIILASGLFVFHRERRAPR
jgi:drug/metabolite transporter (DMT)-like permease